MPNINLNLPLTNGVDVDYQSVFQAFDTTLNFTGAGVTVTQGPSGQANIAIPGSAAAATNSFVFMVPITGTTPTATTPTSTLNFTSSSGTMSIVGNAGTDTLDFNSALIYTSPLSISGHTISMTQANSTTNGWLSSVDWNTFNNKQPAGTYVTSVTASSPIASSGGITPNISLTGVVPIANGGTNNAGPFTAGSVIFSNGTALTQDNANFFWNDTNFSLGLSTNTPASNAFIDAVQSSAAAKRIQLTGYGAGSFVGYRGRFARGTVGTPAAAQAGDTLNFLSGQGYGTSQFPATSTGVVNIVANETFTNTSNATYVSFFVTPTGSTTSAEAARVNSTGNVLIGTTTDSGTQKLQVNGNSNVGTVTAGVWNGTVTAGESFITSGTTYTTPAGITTATLFKFTLIGGGGGSAGVATTNGRGAGGGGAGGVILFITGLTPSTAYTIAIGAGGAAGAATPTAGGSGGNTTLTIGATTYTAGGGGGGPVGASTVGGLPGGGTNGTINSAGEWGGWNSTAAAANIGGKGGNSAFGFGAGGPGMGSNTFFGTVIGGSNYGGGAGGAADVGSGTAGGAGAQGCILVEWKN